ncbi:hypothetical protein GCM10022224_092320 [Nonomuraea antimicrobica]|uniref:Uncharacterized protein n=1 Tax=Nonomuraea antimicrobica TaxID=561173 RepID=A0ABP7E0H0_9ACTN
MVSPARGPWPIVMCGVRPFTADWGTWRGGWTPAGCTCPTFTISVGEKRQIRTTPRIGLFTEASGWADFRVSECERSEVPPLPLEVVVYHLYVTLLSALSADRPVPVGSAAPHRAPAR